MKHFSGSAGRPFHLPLETHSVELHQVQECFHQESRAPTREVSLFSQWTSHESRASVTGWAY